MRCRPRHRFTACAGQASADYVGLIALFALVVTVAATAVAVPSLAADVVRAMRHGICVVGGGICTAREARDAGLDACVIHVRSDAEQVGGVIAVVRLSRGDTALVERRSDGTAGVSFLDDNAVGAQTGIGLQLTGAASAAATAGAGLSFNTGRAYDFSSWAAARRFLSRYADEETTAGEGRNLARRISPLHEPHRLPAATSTSFEAGTWAQLDAELAGSLPRAGVELTGASAIAGELRLYGQTTDLGALADRLREASAGTTRIAQAGRTMQVTASLDLTIPENRVALVGALDVLRLRAAPPEWRQRLDSFGARLNANGRVDVAVYRSAARQSEQSAGLGLGLQLGVEQVRTEETRELIAAWTAQGTALREREDCLPGAAA